MPAAIPIILSTGSLFNFDVDTAMALAAGAGYDGVELMIDWRRETQNVDHLQTLSARHKLPILAVHSPFTEMFLPGWPRDPVASIKHSVALAEQVAAQVVVVHPPGRWLRLQGKIAAPGSVWKLTLPLPIVGPGHLGRWLTDDLAHFQTQTPVKIAVENMPCRRLGPLILEPHHFTSPQRLCRFLYVTLDTTHVGTRGDNLFDIYRQVAPQVAHVHLSNFNGKQHQLPGNGHLPLADFLRHLARRHFSGLISLELSPTSLQAHDKAALQKNLRRSLEFCRQALGQS